ncbi:MAG: methionine/alanine import family NSS transporter small subunit [Cellulomonas sp.]
MTAAALMVLIVSLGVVWGGLIASAVYLRRQPEDDADDPGEVDGSLVLHDL